MKDLKILLTACGCPGASTMIQQLKGVSERRVKVVGVDMDPEAVGRFLADGFHQVPPAHSKEYIPSLLELVEKEEPDVLFPQSSSEVYPIAKNKKRFEDAGAKVLVSSPEAIESSNDKYRMYEKLQGKVPLPKYKLADSLEAFVEAAHDLGYPGKAVVFKPPVGKGSRGVRIMDPAVSRKDQLLCEKPSAKYMSLEEFKSIFEKETFPSFLVMEYLRGDEITADSLALDGRELLTTVKTVEQARWGVIVRGELVRRDDLVGQARKILDVIPLSYCVNLQFIDGKLIEINPRVSTFIYQPDLIAPYLAIKLALGELSCEDIKAYNAKIDYGRRMVRYMDQVFFHG